MKRIIATIFTATTALAIASSTASAMSQAQYDLQQTSLQSSSSSIFGSSSAKARDLHTGLTIGLCADGSVDIAGLANEPGVYGVSMVIFNEITPLMTSKPFSTGEMVNVHAESKIPAIPGLPVTLVASRAPVGAYDDSVRAEYSVPVKVTVPSKGCSFNPVKF